MPQILLLNQNLHNNQRSDNLANDNRTSQLMFYEVTESKN